MECDAHVNAHLVFSYYTPDGQLLGEATAFSSEEGFSYTADFLVDMSGGAGFGVAIANLRSLPSDFALTFRFDNVKRAHPDRVKRTHPPG